MDEKCCFSISLVIMVIVHVLYACRQIRVEPVYGGLCVCINWSCDNENRLAPDLEKTAARRRSIMNSSFPGPFVFIQLPTFVIFRRETESLIPLSRRTHLHRSACYSEMVIGIPIQSVRYTLTELRAYAKRP